MITTAARPGSLYVFAGELLRQFRVLEELGVRALVEGLRGAARVLRGGSRGAAALVRARARRGDRRRRLHRNRFRHRAVLHEMHLRQVMPVRPLGNERRVAESALHDRVSHNRVVARPAEREDARGAGWRRRRRRCARSTSLRLITELLQSG